MRRYIRRTVAMLRNLRIPSAQERHDFKVLRAANVLSYDSLGGVLGKVSSEAHGIRKYLRFAAGGAEGVDREHRRPFLGFSPHIYMAEHPVLNRPPFQDALAHWVESGRPPGRWIRDVHRFDIPAKAGRCPSKLNVALHVHLHYPEVFDEIITRIGRNKSRPDLFISVSHEDNIQTLRDRLHSYAGQRIEIKVVPNRGRDLGPMITAFGDELMDYDVIAHLHGKKSILVSPGPSGVNPGEVWREFLFENLIGGKTDTLDQTLELFESRPNLGMIFPEDPNVVGWTANYDVAIGLSQRLGLSGDLPSSIEFPIGNMFFARPAALATILQSGLEWSDYPAEPLGYDATMLHALERLTPSICEHSGFTWLTTAVPGVTR